MTYINRYIYLATIDTDHSNRHHEMNINIIYSDLDKFLDHLQKVTNISTKRSKNSLKTNMYTSSLMMHSTNI